MNNTLIAYNVAERFGGYGNKSLVIREDKTSQFVEEISGEFETDLMVFEKLIKNNQEVDSFIMRDCIMRNIIGLLETIESIDDNAFDEFKKINYEEG